MLAADGERESEDALSAQHRLLLAKCLGQVQLHIANSRYPARVAMSEVPAIHQVVGEAMELHAYTNQDTVRSVAYIVQALVPKYRHSLAAIYGVAEYVSLHYDTYARSVLSTLDWGTSVDGKSGDGNTDGKKGHHHNTKLDVERRRWGGWSESVLH